MISLSTLSLSLNSLSLTLSRSLALSASLSISLIPHTHALSHCRCLTIAVLFPEGCSLNTNVGWSISSSMGTILTTAEMVGMIDVSNMNSKKVERMHLNYYVRKQNVDTISATSSNPIVCVRECVNAFCMVCCVHVRVDCTCVYNVYICVGCCCVNGCVQRDGIRSADSRTGEPLVKCRVQIDASGTVHISLRSVLLVVQRCHFAYVVTCPEDRCDRHHTQAPVLAFRQLCS